MQCDRDQPREPKLHWIDAETQARLDTLMDKNTEGTLTAAERKELNRLGEMVERLSLDNAKMLAEQAEKHGGTSPARIVWPDIEARARRTFGDQVFPNPILLERDEEDC